MYVEFSTYLFYLRSMHVSFNIFSDKFMCTTVKHYEFYLQKQNNQ